MHGGTVVATGIMDEIRTLLSKGRTSRAIIDAGYAPGTVYKVQRGFRSGDNPVRLVQSTSLFGSRYSDIVGSEIPPPVTGT